MMKVLFVALVLLLVNTSAHGQRVSTTTGNSLLESCEAEHEFFKQGFCAGYIIGVTDMDAVERAEYSLSRKSCVPDTVTNGQLKDVVVKYLKDHPEQRHLSAAILVMEAMAQAFPCKAK